MLKDLSVKDFVAETASDSPAPGGGSVAALAAAQAAALLGMVANLTLKGDKYAEVHAEMAEIAKSCKASEEDFIEDIDRDANSFNGVMAAFKLPKETDEDKKTRTAKIQEEYKKAANVPLSVGLKAAELLEAAEVLAKKGNPNAITDVGVGVLNAKLAVTGAFYNVKINLGSIKDEAYVEDLKKQMKEAEETVEARAKEVLKTVESMIE